MVSSSLQPIFAKCEWFEIQTSNIPLFYIEWIRFVIKLPKFVMVQFPAQLFVLKDRYLTEMWISTKLSSQLPFSIFLKKSIEMQWKYMCRKSPASYIWYWCSAAKYSDLRYEKHSSEISNETQRKQYVKCIPISRWILMAEKWENDSTIISLNSALISQQRMKQYLMTVGCTIQSLHLSIVLCCDHSQYAQPNRTMRTFVHAFHFVEPCKFQKFWQI